MLALTTTCNRRRVEEVIYFQKISSSTAQLKNIYYLHTGVVLGTEGVFMFGYNTMEATHMEERNKHDS